MEKELSLQRRLVRYFGSFGLKPPVSPLAAEAGIRVVNLSLAMRVFVPPLFFSSIPKRAIGFSYPRGRVGLIIGASILGLAFFFGNSLSANFGPLSVLLFLWLLGGSGALLIYNSVGRGVAFVKPLCYTCRLLPVIEEHEAIHLSGAASETACWEDARRRYSYSGLGLAGDPRICSFCPIAKRLREA